MLSGHSQQKYVLENKTLHSILHKSTGKKHKLSKNVFKGAIRFFALQQADKPNYLIFLFYFIFKSK